MKALSPHFFRHEFSCPCGCGFSDVSIELVAILEGVRQYFERPVFIKKGCSCTHYNKICADEYASQHLLGTAADFIVDTIEPDKVADYLEAKYAQQYGIGRSNTYTHIDVRAAAVRWWE
ncbi:D-Ala-D-Ala carboxypeptidase family metallohydrolase [Buttiauxella gaviniae]|uniref:D-Ala-D-Ala carboxypeptidase family metallohydrolase n=1 Tax=Buttiauxella gaviniae TaxID=82990 RepID=A0ABV3NPA0_9ENTR